MGKVRIRLYLCGVWFAVGLQVWSIGRLLTQSQSLDSSGLLLTFLSDAAVGVSGSSGLM